MSFFCYVKLFIVCCIMMRLVHAQASNRLQANTLTKTQIKRKQSRNSGIKAKIFKTHHLSPSLPCYLRFILYIQLQRTTYTPVRKEFPFKNQNCNRNMINNYLRKWRLIIVSVFTAQKPTNLFITFIIPKYGRKFNSLRSILSHRLLGG